MKGARLNESIRVRNGHDFRPFFVSSLRHDLIFAVGNERPSELSRTIAFNVGEDEYREQASDMLYDYLDSFGTTFACPEQAKILKELGHDMNVMNYYRQLCPITDRVYYWHVSGYLVA